MILSIDEVNDILDAAAESLPPALFGGLNGGVNLLEEERNDSEFPRGAMYLLGEYCDDSLGRYINLYYGSFAALARRESWSREDWAAELEETLCHELTHHMETLSGLHALDDRDEAELEQWRQSYQKAPEE
ncbi:metallopeptidase family protein [Dysosmobacter sp.]